MKHGCFTSLQSPIDSQPSDLNAMNRIQSVEGATISWQGYDISILECAWYYIHRLPRKEPEHQQQVLHSVIEAFK
jgi:hypothetical protein